MKIRTNLCFTHLAILLLLLGHSRGQNQEYVAVDYKGFHQQAISRKLMLHKRFEIVFDLPEQSVPVSVDEAWQVGLPSTTIQKTFWTRKPQDEWVLVPLEHAGKPPIHPPHYAFKLKQLHDIVITLREDAVHHIGRMATAKAQASLDEAKGYLLLWEERGPLIVNGASLSASEMRHRTLLALIEATRRAQATDAWSDATEPERTALLQKQLDWWKRLMNDNDEQHDEEAIRRRIEGANLWFQHAVSRWLSARPKWNLSSPSGAPTPVPLSDDSLFRTSAMAADFRAVAERLWAALRGTNVKDAISVKVQRNLQAADSRIPKAKLQLWENVGSQAISEWSPTNLELLLDGLSWLYPPRAK